MWEEVQEAVREKKDYSSEFRIVLPDGTVKYLEATGHHLFSANGELVEVISTHVDVTERKRVEEALRESEAKIRRLVDSNIIGIFIWDLEGRVSSRPMKRFFTSCSTTVKISFRIAYAGRI